MPVYFGGPDQPVGALADLLSSRINSVPAGGEIHWVTYYFGNDELAQSLVKASQRGVRVVLDIEAWPRRPEVNANVLRQLGGLKDNLRIITHHLPCHVHEKIYFFSHPVPLVYTGSYNPSRNVADPPELLQDIGDQDRGHNFLVEIAAGPAVAFLRSHLQAMHSHSHSMFERFSPHLNGIYHSPELSIYFFPRMRSNVHANILRGNQFERVRVAVSHFRDSSVARLLTRLATRGTAIEVLAHDSFRRVPARVERTLTYAGVRFTRYRHPEGLPMHNKFMLLEGMDERKVLFGSLNLTRTSRWLNHEVLIQSSDQSLIAAFDRRWNEIFAEATRQGDPA